MNVLVTDGNLKHTLGITRALGREGHGVYVLGNKESVLAGKSVYCRKVLVTLDWNKDANQEKYVEQVTDYIKQYKIDLLMPVGYKNFSILTKYKKELEQIVNFISVDNEKIEFAANKRKAMEIAKKLDIDIPQTYYPSSLEEVANISDMITYPCVIKSQLEHGGNIVAYPHEAYALLKTYKEIVEQHKFSAAELPIIQEYLTGDGYGFFAFYVHGQCTQIFMHHRLREYPITGGSSARSESFYDEELLTKGKKILDFLEWHGVAMVEFKKNLDGKYNLLEINPKFWGSLDLALASGALFPNLMVKYCQGQEIPFSAEYIRNLQYHWPVHGDLRYAISRPGEAYKILFDCLNPKVKSNLWFREDHLVTWHLTLNYPIILAKEIIKSRFRRPVGL